MDGVFFVDDIVDRNDQERERLIPPMKNFLGLSRWEFSYWPLAEQKKGSKSMAHGCLQHGKAKMVKFIL